MLIVADLGLPATLTGLPNVWMTDPVDVVSTKVTVPPLTFPVSRETVALSVAAWPYVYGGDAGLVIVRVVVVACPKLIPARASMKSRKKIL